MQPHGWGEGVPSGTGRKELRFTSITFNELGMTGSRNTMDPFTVAYAAYLAIIAALLVIVSGLLRDRKSRILLHLVCGCVLACFVGIVNPQFEDGIAGLPYYLALLLSPLVLPLFIAASLFIVGAGRPSLLKTPAVFFGAFVSVLLYLEIMQYGIVRLGAAQWRLELFIGIACVLVLSGLVFFILDWLLCRISGEPTSRQEAAGTDVACTTISRQKRLAVLSAVILLVLCSPMALVSWISYSAVTCGGFDVYEVNESAAKLYTVVAVTGDDFSRFPRMKPFLTGDQAGDSRCSEGLTIAVPGTCIGTGTYLCSEGKMVREYGNSLGGTGTDSTQPVILEYGGRYFYLMKTWVT